MTTRESVHNLVDDLSPSSLEFAAVALRRLLESEKDPIWEQLENAPVDDEPLSAATIARLDAARARLGNTPGPRVANARKR